MERSFSESYKQAGVDITAGYKAVELMKKHIARTVTAGAASDIGGFGGLFELDLTGMTRPVLVSGTDGVGTKLKYAFMLQKHDTIGIDCVAMCVNDVICCGAKPLFFLDYIACGKNVPERIASIVAGVAEGCVQAGAALIGGETAEMPGFYPEDEYDLAGFAVGVVDRAKVLDNSAVKAGDAVIALPSSGVHSNGFSLVRKIFEGRDMTAPVAELGGKSLGETLLTPTKIYVKPMLALFEAVKVKAVSHITGGGVELCSVAAYEGIGVDAGGTAACPLHVGVAQRDHERGVGVESLSEPVYDYIDVVSFGDGLQAYHDIGGVGVGPCAAAYGGGEASHGGIGGDDGMKFLHGSGQRVKGDGFFGPGKDAYAPAVDSRKVSRRHQSGEPPCSHDEQQ